MIDASAVFIKLIQNLALLVALTFVFGLFRPMIVQFAVRFQILANGLLFGAFAIAVMLTPLELAPGVLLDGRTMIIAIAAAFGGWRAALIAVLIVIPVRLMLGGPGSVSGIGMMLTSTIIGEIFRRRFANHSYRPAQLALLGLIVAGQSIGWTLLLPPDLVMEAISDTALPMLLVYPAGIALLGMLLTREREAVHNLTELRQHEAQLRESTRTLIRFGDSLKQLHYLSTTDYDSLDDLFDDCLRVGQLILRMPHGVISQVNSDEYHIRAAQTDVPDFAPGSTLLLAEMYCALVVKSGQSIAFSTVGQMPDMQDHPAYQQYGFESVISTPIFVQGRLYGTLAFFSEQARGEGFATLEIEALELLAASLSHTLTRHAAEAAQQETEQRYHSAVGAMSNGLVIHYADGSIRVSNQSAAQILSLTPDQITGNAPLEPGWHIVHEDGSAFSREDNPAMTALKTGQPQKNVIMGIHKPDGTQTWISANSQPMFNAGESQPYAAVTSFEDITHRRQTELKLTERVYQLHMLHRAESQLNEQLDVRHVLRTGLQVALQVSDAEHGFIFLMDTDGSQLSDTVGGYSIQPPTADSITQILQCGHEPVLFTDHLCCTALLDEPVNAQMILPLRSHHHLMGVLNLETSRAERFTPAAFDTLKLIVVRIAVALENAQLYRTTQHQLAELQALHQQVAYQAEHDALTGLVNRQTFAREVADAIRQATLIQQRIGVLYVDLDRFKIVNDAYGHAVGDAFLCRVANQLQMAVGVEGTVARLGGDEFAVAIHQLHTDQQAEALAQRILDKLRQPFVIEGTEFTASASIGVSFYPDDGVDAQTLLRRADSALYRSKVQGRNTYRIYQPDDHQIEPRQVSLEQGLQHALENGELFLHYQPQYHLRRSQIVGFEALLRWQNPHYGLISPADFIPIAEASGLIVPIGAWLLEEACRQCRAWHEGGANDLHIAVNISAVQFRRDDFIGVIERALANTNLEPPYLELELTESMLIDSGIQFQEKLKRIRALGVQVSIDDFGTGYSSLSYLQNLPIDKIKLDRSFIQTIDDPASSGGRVITKSVISLARKLGMHVLAEGVETEAQRQILRQMGCEMVQGYLFSAPLPPDKVEALLAISTSTTVEAAPGN